MAAFNGQACTREECKLSPRWNGGFVLFSNALSTYALKLGRYFYYTAHECLLAYVYFVPACKFGCWHLQTAATAYVCHSRTTQARRQSALVAVEPAQLRQLHEGECINAVGWPKLWRPSGGPDLLRLAWPIHFPRGSDGLRLRRWRVRQVEHPIGRTERGVQCIDPVQRCPRIILGLLLLLIELRPVVAPPISWEEQKQTRNQPLHLLRQQCLDLTRWGE